MAALKHCILSVFLIFVLFPFSSLNAADSEKTYSFEELVKKERLAIVNIRSKEVEKKGNSPLKDYFRLGKYLKPEVKEGSLGTGFIIHASGLLLTNYHLFTPPPTYEEVGEIRIFLANGESFSAKIIGKDKKIDIALLQIEGGADFSSVTLGDSERLEVGEWVMAIGNPFGIEELISVGIVSGTGRMLGTGPYDHFIQTDAVIHAGNTGGPLYNIRGEVVGINTIVAISGHGIGFAAPINRVKKVIPMLQAHGKITRGWLGVVIQSLNRDLARAFELPNARGALVSEVMAGSPAEDGGLFRGDVILKFDGKVVQKMQDLPTFVAETAVGKNVPVDLIRDGKALQIQIKIRQLEEE